MLITVTSHYTPAPLRRKHSFRHATNHTCPKDFVENRNISNILEEAPLRNKLELGEPQASGNLSPLGRHNHSPGCSRNAAEPWVKRRTYQNPERSERVAESAAKTLSQSFPSPGSRPSVSAEAPPRQDAVAGCHPLRYAPGFRSFFVPYPGFRRYRGCTLG